MLSDWSAECSHDAPTLVVPWADSASGAHFIDLRSHPYDLAEIVEAEHQPVLGRALRSLNSTRSPFLTAKCDAWPLAGATHAAQLGALALELELDPGEARFGFGSYIDLLWRERSVFASAHQQQDRLDRIVRRAQRLPHREAALECVLRPALLDLSGPLEGFSVTLYVTALGTEAEIAHRRWELALEDIVALLRGRDLESARGSATIDAADAYPLRVRNFGE
jgi:hypothetical protein